MKLHSVATTAAVLVGLALVPPPAQAQTASANTSTADAYGVLVAARLLQGNVPLNVGPLSESSQADPPGAAGPSTASLVSVPAVPADGSVIQGAGAVVTSARADSAPSSTASAETANVRLLPTAGTPLISADVIKAASATSCTSAPSAAGSEFVNLKVGQVTVPANPAPNTTIPLGVVTVIVNEQHPTADGRGLVVNGLHIIAPGSAPTQALLQGDVIISHAVSTVTCANGAGSTATTQTTPVQLSKTPSPTTVTAGGTVTYQATATDHGPSPCLVNELIDHLPVGFTFSSTSGDLGTKASTMTRPDKGIDVVVVPTTSVTIAPGASVHQTFVTTATTTPGTYANDLELLCSDLGDFESTGAPVTVTAPPAPAAAPTPPPAQATSTNTETTPAALPNTGGPGPIVPLSGAALLAGALTLAVRRRRLRAPDAPKSEVRG